MRIAILGLCLLSGLAACSSEVTGQKSPCFGPEVMQGCYFAPLAKPSTLTFTGD